MQRRSERLKRQRQQNDNEFESNQASTRTRLQNGSSNNASSTATRTNNNGNNNNQGTLHESAVDEVYCPRCENNIPYSNWLQHQAQCCSHRSLPLFVDTDNDATHAVAEAPEEIPETVTTRYQARFGARTSSASARVARSNARSREITSPEGVYMMDSPADVYMVDEDSDEVEVLSPTTYLTNRSVNNGEYDASNSTNSSLQMPVPPSISDNFGIDHVILGLSGNPSNMPRHRSRIAIAITGNTQHGWNCSHCTFRNLDGNAYTCEMCELPRATISNTSRSNDNSSMRPPDVVRRDRLIDSETSSTPSDRSQHAANARIRSRNTHVSVGSGAVLGGFLGGTGALLSGRGISSGIVQGAVSGAMTAAFISEVNSVANATSQARQTRSLQQPQQSQPTQQGQAEVVQAQPTLPQATGTQSRSTQQTRSRAAQPHDPYAESLAVVLRRVPPELRVISRTVHRANGGRTTDTNGNRNDNAASGRRNVGIHVTVNGTGMNSIRNAATGTNGRTGSNRNNAGTAGGGYRTRSIAASGRNNDITERDLDIIENIVGNGLQRRAAVLSNNGLPRGRFTLVRAEGGRQDSLMETFLQSLSAHSFAAPDLNPGNMSYEQLLQIFGTGSDHLAATQEQIDALPTSTLVDPVTELPTSYQQCAICLDDFNAGDLRKTMPCFHGFHKDCIDKWLKNNAACPICKARLESEDDDDDEDESDNNDRGGRRGGRHNSRRNANDRPDRTMLATS